MAKTLLGGHVYVVHPDPSKNGCWIVGKLGSPGSAREEYFVDENGVCSCTAGDFGNVCKHVKMATRKLEGPEFSRRRAENILEGFVDTLKEQFPEGKIISLLRYKTTRRVSKATALGTNLLQEDTPGDRLDIWGERNGLLVLVQILRDPQHFKKALAKIRYLHSGGKIPKADKQGIVAGYGQTYGRA